MAADVDIQRLADREEIKELRASYCYCLDRQDWEQFTTLFTDDVVLDFGARIGRKKGQEGIEELTEFFDDLYETSSLMVTNPKIAIDGDTATGHWYVDGRESFESGKTGLTQGEYRDVYRRVDGDWTIAEMDFQLQYQLIFDEQEEPESLRRKTPTDPL